MSGPHQGQPVAEAGAPAEDARAAVILVHGRGASATSMLGFADSLAQPGVLFHAPQAAGSTWYPHAFLRPLASNEPGLSSGLQVLADVLHAITDAGIPPERTVLLGFSQGACLASEFAARRGGRLGGVVALSGGLIGTGEIEGQQPPHDKRFDYDTDLAGTPVFVGCSDVDPHIPLVRVQQTTAVFRRLHATVTERIYPGMGHTINQDEVAFVRALLQRVQAGT